MLRVALPACSKQIFKLGAAKPSVIQRRRVDLAQITLPSSRRYRNAFAHQSKGSSKSYRPRPGEARRGNAPWSHQNKSEPTEPHVLAEDVPLYLAPRAADWSKMPELRRRLERFGIPKAEIPLLLKKFVEAVRDEHILEEEGANETYTLERFAGSFTGSNKGRLDECLTNVFYAWASLPSTQASLLSSSPVTETTLHQINRLYIATSLAYPADIYPEARAMKRKLIMHVGPTNSGKTYHALRALAAAEMGVYAGPLRLLAHEIWERLNKGGIVPLGMDPDPATTIEADPDSSLDVVEGDGAQGKAPAIVKPKGIYSRPCNLLTGEESKVVSDNAGLLSCTIEMMSTHKRYSVAVIDEIQMIADPERGAAWTRAVLGAVADELHLCGEDTALPIIEALCRETGDELIVNRYERLTPLVVEETSLNGDLSKVRKGDCIVTFSRSGIFALKRQVEEATGMRCAVAYGKLPPELRSEQARLFNDPGSGYDVMVGSDAIGMGLNLKIKRVIFEQVHKFNGTEEIQLSTSQMKQIAGRAGRYGVHADDSLGGSTTTLHANDLPILRRELAKSNKSLMSAYVSSESWSKGEVVRTLPHGSGSLTEYEAFKYVSRCRWPYQHMILNRVHDLCEFIDQRANSRGVLTHWDKTLLMSAPYNWRDKDAVDVLAQFYNQFSSDMRVDLVSCLTRMKKIQALQEVEEFMRSGAGPRASPESLGELETLHKILVFYLWMQLRQPIFWSSGEAGNGTTVNELKERVEIALDWCLQGISWRNQRPFQTPQSVRLLQKKEEIAFLSGDEVRLRKTANANAKMADGAMRTA